MAGWRAVGWAADTTINGINYKAGTEIWFWLNGKVLQGTLAADTVIWGVSYGAGIQITANNDYGFSGEIRSFKLSADTTIAGIPLKAGTLAVVNDGKLRIVTLSAETVINGRTYKAGTTIEFRGKGKISRVKLPYD